MWVKRGKGWRMCCDVLLILQAFIHFTYVTSHSDSPSFPSLHLRHSKFSNPSLALPTSQLILQPFRCFTYVAAHSPTILSLHLRHRISTYVTWRAAHGDQATPSMSYYMSSDYTAACCGTYALEIHNFDNNGFRSQTVNIKLYQ